MSAAKGKNWRDQLNVVKKEVERKEKERALRAKMELERSRDALAERLTQDTPEALNNRFNELKKACRQTGQKLYPPDELRELETQLQALGEVLEYYEITRHEHPDMFSTPMRQTLARLTGGVNDLHKSVEKQLKQWKGVEAFIEATDFRPRTEADDNTLIEIAKSFSETAYGMPLSLPGDYFATEKENFWVADANGTVYGYVKYWPADNAISFALAEPDKVNWRKLLRAFLYVFCTQGPVADTLDAIHVRLSDPSEYRFYQDLGFRRTGGLTTPVCSLPLE